MSEKFLPRQETGRATDLRASCTESLKQANTPREIIVVMKNWVLMRENLKKGRYINMQAEMDGARQDPNPYEALRIRDELGLNDLGLGLERSVRVAEDAQSQLDTALADFIELAWQKFSRSNPSPEEVDLFREQIPAMADRADSLKKD